MDMTAGPTNFFRTILIAILIYFAYKAVIRIFRAVSKKPKSDYRNSESSSNTEPRSQNKHSRGGDTIGEYVDFEEV